MFSIGTGRMDVCSVIRSTDMKLQNVSFSSYGKVEVEGSLIQNIQY